MKYFLFLFLLLGCKSAQNQVDCIDTSKINADAMCVQIYKPVCGCDGKTYSNDCVATNSGVTSWTDGECKTGSSGQ